MNRTKMAGASIQNCDFRAVKAQDSDFTGADMRHVSLYGTSFKGCNFTEANLKGADLSYADLGGSAFGDANLQGVDLRGTILDSARELKGRQLSQARTSEITVLPNGTRGPYVPGTGAENARPRDVTRGQDSQSARLTGPENAMDTP